MHISMFAGLDLQQLQYSVTINAVAIILVKQILLDTECIIMIRNIQEMVEFLMKKVVN